MKNLEGKWILQIFYPEAAIVYSWLQLMQGKAG